MEKIKSENIKKKIMDTAIKLFSEKGFDGVSIREICKEADVNISMISYYFGGKKELYNGIFEDLLNRQNEFAQSFIDFSKNPYDMSEDEKVEAINLYLDKFVSFFYANVSADVASLLLKEQQNSQFKVKSPVLEYIRKLVGAIMGKPENDKEVIFKTLFMLSQINSPRILPAFSLRLLDQDDFVPEDIEIIKNNVKKYVNLMIKEMGS